jgi:tRNA U34 5-methylaminomethyl-2-thiouridine-forming methyltransferase MnmC
LEWLTEQLANQCSQHGELEPFRTYHLQLSEFVTLHLIVGDATDLPWLAAQGVAADAFHAVYFDAFSPESSPAMWGDGVLRYASDRLQRGGTLTSYCVKGDVKRSLRACGMQVITAPGPVHGKREVLIATRPISQGMGRA